MKTNIYCAAFGQGSALDDFMLPGFACEKKICEICERAIGAGGDGQKF